MRLSPSIALLRTQSDDRLVVLAREGHEPAFTALVERYRRQVIVACRRVLPESRAEDAAQQVFVSAWRALGRGDEVREVRPWLLRIARNTSLNALRVQGYDYDQLAGSLQGGEGPQAELERHDVMRQTLAGLAALPENQREALLRSAVQGAAHADIARDLGISEGATRQLVLRARTTLRSAITAVTPLPLVQWAARAGEHAGAETAVRISEVAAGGGASAMMAKFGIVAVVAGGAAATPVVIHHGNRADAPKRAAAKTADRSARTTSAATRAPAAATPAPTSHRNASSTTVSTVRNRNTAAPQRPLAHRQHAAQRADGDHGRDGGSGTRPQPDHTSGPDHASGPGPSGADDVEIDTQVQSDDHSGRGRGNDDSNDTSVDEDSSGHGNDDSEDAAQTPEPVETPKPARTPEADDGGDDEESAAVPTPLPTSTAVEEDSDKSGHGGGEDDLVDDGS
jgi:RNA polymerase sigma factor (sigma-70 family)